MSQLKGLKCMYQVHQYQGSPKTYDRVGDHEQELTLVRKDTRVLIYTRREAKRGKETRVTPWKRTTKTLITS